jgi:hypothetical protein
MNLSFSEAKVIKLFKIVEINLYTRKKEINQRVVLTTISNSLFGNAEKKLFLSPCGLLLC